VGIADENRRVGGGRFEIGSKSERRSQSMNIWTWFVANFVALLVGGLIGWNLHAAGLLTT
jgi:hypothetical protein